MNIAVIGAGMGKSCLMHHNDLPIVILASQNEVTQFKKEPEQFSITSNQRDYVEFDYLTKVKKPVNKEWKKRIKNFQNSIK